MAEKAFGLGMQILKCLIQDVPLLAEMNKCLIEDEQSSNKMNLQKLEKRMAFWKSLGFIEILKQTACDFLTFSAISI